MSKRTGLTDKQADTLNKSLREGAGFGDVTDIVFDGFSYRKLTDGEKASLETTVGFVPEAPITNERAYAGTASLAADPAAVTTTGGTGTGTGGTTTTT